MDELNLVEGLLLRVKAIITYANGLPSASGEAPSGLAPDDELVTFDHVEIAEELLLGALTDVRPELGEPIEDGSDIRLSEVEATYTREQPATARGVANLFRDAVELLEAAELLSELHPYGTSEAWDQIVLARHDLEAALHVIDPTWHSTRLAQADPDERIDLAARFEEHEVRTEALRGMNSVERLLNEASAKVFGEGVTDPRAADLGRRLSTPTPGDEDSLLDDLEAFGLSSSEARVLLSHLTLDWDSSPPGADGT